MTLRGGSLCYSVFMQYFHMFSNLTSYRLKAGAIFVISVGSLPLYYNNEKGGLRPPAGAYPGCVRQFGNNDP